MLTVKQLAGSVILSMCAHSAFACGDGKNVGIYAPTATPGTWTLVDSGYYPGADLAAFDAETDAPVYPGGGDLGGGGGGGGLLQSVGDAPWSLSYTQEPIGGDGAYTQSMPCMPEVTVTPTPTSIPGSGRLHVIFPTGGGRQRFAALKRAQVPADRALCSSTDQAAKDAEACRAIRRVRSIVSAGMTFLVEFADATQLYTVVSSTGSYCAVPSGPCVPN
jgi:hypothetical protein